jgi:hypothetical protein
MPIKENREKEANKDKKDGAEGWDRERSKPRARDARNAKVKKGKAHRRGYVTFMH